MTKRQRELERIHLLSTMCEIGRAAPASEICERANNECSVGEDDPRLDEIDALPVISARGITAKLDSMMLDGLVTTFYGVPLKWSVLPKGRELAYEPGSD